MNLVKFFLLRDTQIEKDMNEEFVSKNTSFTNLKFITSKEIKEGKNVENSLLHQRLRKYLQITKFRCY